MIYRTMLCLCFLAVAALLGPTVGDRCPKTTTPTIWADGGAPPPPPIPYQPRNG